MIVLTGSRRVFSGSGIRPKYRAGIGKTTKILTGSGIWLLAGKRDSPKFGHGMRDFFACLLGIREFVTTQTNVPPAKAAGVSFQTQVCLVNSYLIETVREYFVLIRCQKSLCGVIAYQLSTPLLNWFSCSISSKVHIYCLEGIFSKAKTLDGPGYGNSYASFATVRVIVVLSCGYRRYL